MRQAFDIRLSLSAVENQKERPPVATHHKINPKSTPSEPFKYPTVIGTHASVYPAEGYTHVARLHGTKFSVFDMEPKHEDNIDREKPGD